MQLSLRQKLLVVSTTKDQKKAIELNGKSILVSASAGSGKTEVLSKRILSKILLHQSSIKNILAMTFTNAAAAEMKNRIAKAINYELNYHKLDEKEMLRKVFYNQENFEKIKQLYEDYQELSIEDENYLLDEKSNLLNADITTIDGFALSIVKRFFIVLDNFKLERLNHLLPESKRVHFLNLSVKKVINQYYKQNYDLLIEYGELRKSFIQLISKLSIYPDPIKKIEEYREINSQTQVLDLKQPKAIEFLIYRTNALKNEMKKSIISYLQEIDNYKENKRRVLARDYLKKIMTLFGKKLTNVEEVNQLFSKLDSMEHPAVSTSKEFSDYLNNEINLFNKNIEKLFKLIDANFKVKAQDMNIFYDMLRDVYLNYETLKIEENFIEFSDITRYAVEILEKSPEIRKQYQDHFDEILVDEFQDTNEIQDYLIRLISKDNTNVFRVGDIKQSIYGFRQAKPAIMKGYYDLYQSNPNLGENIVLNINFRSSPEIIEFNNVAFNALMNVANMPSAFSKQADYAYANALPTNNPVIFHRLITEEKDESKMDKSFKYIGSEILKNLNENNYKDFAILVRSNEQVRTASRILEDMNIPHFALMDNPLNDTEIIQLLLAIHSLCEDIKNDLYFTAVASSRLFNYSFDEISLIRLKSKYDLFENSPQDLKEFIFEIKKYGGFRERTLAILNYRNFYIEYLDDEEKIIVDYLLTLLESENIFTIQQGIDFLNQLKESEYLKPIRLDSSSNVVTIMNVHKSKGLEFKNVYLYCIDNESYDTSGVMYKYHDDLGVSFEYRVEGEKVSNLYHELIIQKNRMSDIEEDLRILYVATTRAKNQLHLVGFSKYKNESLSMSLLEGASKYASYLLAIRYLLQEKNLLDVIEVDYDTYEFELSYSDNEIVYSTFKQYEYQKEILEKTSAHHIEEVQPLVFDGIDTYIKGSLLHKEIELSAKTRISSNSKVQALFKNEKFNYLLDHYDCYFELAYTYRNHHKLESGYMDFVAIGEDIIVVDFKSDQFSDYEIRSKITEEELKSRYINQLTLYQNALLQAYPTKPVKAYIYSLELEKMIEIN